MVGRRRLTETVVNNLVRDCITFRLSDKDALQYILEYTGVKYSKPWIRRRRDLVNADPEVNAWLNEHTRIGFVRTHKRLTEELEAIQSILMGRMKRARDEEDDEAITTYTDKLLAVNKRMNEMNIGLPILGQMRQKLEEKIQTGPPAD